MTSTTFLSVAVGGHRCLVAACLRPLLRSRSDRGLTLSRRHRCKGAFISGRAGVSASAPRLSLGIVLLDEQPSSMSSVFSCTWPAFRVRRRGGARRRSLDHKLFVARSFGGLLLIAVATFAGSRRKWTRTSAPWGFLSHPLLARPRASPLALCTAQRSAELGN